MKIQAFKEAFKIPFDLKTDYYHQKTEAFGATVTPEVIVFNESKSEILYNIKKNQDLRISNPRQTDKHYQFNNSFL